DKRWLQRVYSAAQKDYEMWTTGEHRAGDTGFSRYFDYGEGPVPEEAHDGYQYHKDAALGLIKRRNFKYFVPAKPADITVANLPKDVPGANGLSGRVTFSLDFYKGDRALRESGFDITNRFGPYGAETHDYAPVCLNPLLYKVERDLATIAEILGLKTDITDWSDAADRRKQAINRTMWDGRLYSDYRFTDNSLVLYPFASTFYPLAFGIAEKAQADALVTHLDLFARPGGIQTSTALTGLQWDAPYGWAPLQMIAIDGLRRYGYQKQADQLAKSWLSLIIDSFRNEGMIHEKYD